MRENAVEGQASSESLQRPHQRRFAKDCLFLVAAWNGVTLCQAPPPWNRIHHQPRVRLWSAVLCGAAVSSTGGCYRRRMIWSRCDL